MAKENDLKKKLLKQMDKDSAELSEVNINSAKIIIEKHKNRLRKLKWIVAAGWLLTIVYAVAMHNLKVFLLDDKIEDILTSNVFWLIRWSDTCLIVLIIIAALLTFLLYSTSRTLTIMQISARLTQIEEHMKKMSQDK